MIVVEVALRELDYSVAQIFPLSSNTRVKPTHEVGSA